VVRFYSWNCRRKHSTTQFSLYATASRSNGQEIGKSLFLLIIAFLNVNSFIKRFNLNQKVKFQRLVFWNFISRCVSPCSWTPVHCTWTSALGFATSVTSCRQRNTGKMFFRKANKSPIIRLHRLILYNRLGVKRSFSVVLKQTNIRKCVKPCKSMAQRLVFSTKCLWRVVRHRSSKTLERLEEECLNGCKTLAAILLPNNAVATSLQAKPTARKTCLAT